MDQSLSPILCFPDLPPTTVSGLAQAAGLALQAISGAAYLPAPGSYAGAIISMVEDPESSLPVLRAVKLSGMQRGVDAPAGSVGTAGKDSRGIPQAGGTAGVPVFLVVSRSQVDWLERVRGLFDDWCLLESDQDEIGMRVRLLFHPPVGSGEGTRILHYGPLDINLDSYQAAVNGHVLDLTYMEYKLLAFLASNPERVFSREALLTRVWGYDYYGGARTVDVHIRRLRFKMGDRHANMISTIRSVGYMLTSRTAR
ncbi:MAG: response regulator transcription factor [Actinobacteria bacterium]|nr:response regulator transcription factor [Actinomycetota bacterium]